jgi:ankyrin repeat protein
MRNFRLVLNFFIASAVACVMNQGDCKVIAGGRDATQTFGDPKVIALAEAIEREDLDNVDDLVRSGVSVNATGANGQTPLHWSLLRVGIQASTIKHLLALGANPNARLDEGESVLLLAAGGNRADLLELFLQNGGDPNLPDKHNRTPLMDAIAGQYESNVRLLLKYGADPNEGSACLATVANARFDFTMILLESGLTKDLRKCESMIKSRIPPEGSRQFAWRARVLKLLAERDSTNRAKDKQPTR